MKENIKKKQKKKGKKEKDWYDPTDTKSMNSDHEDEKRLYQKSQMGRLLLN